MPRTPHARQRTHSWRCDPHCWYDNAGHFSCSEAETIAEFFRAHGEPDMADRFIGVHGESDDEGDDHYDPNADHEDTECRHCGYPVVHGSGAAVTCDMCGAFCCEDHHRRHPAYAHHDLTAPEPDGDATE